MCRLNGPRGPAEQPDSPRVTAVVTLGIPGNIRLRGQRKAHFRSFRGPEGLKKQMTGPHANNIVL